MAKRPSGQGLLHSTDDPEATSPTRSDSESFTGWPWSVRHDYKHLQVDNASSAASNSSQPLRQGSWGGYPDDVDMGLPAGPSTRRVQQAVVLVIFLKGLAAALEALEATREDLRWLLKLLELCLSVAFMVVVLIMVHSEVSKLAQNFYAKQAISEADRKEEMLRIVRADLVSFREASLRQKAEADRAVAKRFADMDKEFARALQKADGAATYAVEQLASMRQELQAAQNSAETSQVVAVAAAARIEELKSELTALQEKLQESAAKAPEAEGKAPEAEGSEPAQEPLESLKPGSPEKPAREGPPEEAAGEGEEKQVEPEPKESAAADAADTAAAQEDAAAAQEAT